LEKLGARREIAISQQKIAQIVAALQQLEESPSTPNIATLPTPHDL
jgi:hypothetical protein